MGLTTESGGGLSTSTQVHAYKKFLETAQPTLVTEQFTQLFQMPANSTRVANWRRSNALPLATTPVTEGVTPTSFDFTTSKIEVTMQQYIGIVAVSDVVMDTHTDPILMEAMMQMGEQMPQTIEAVRLGVYTGGTNKVQSNGAVRTDINTALNRSTLRVSLRALRRQYAKPISRMVLPSVNYDTTTVAPAFIALSHTDAEMDIRNMTDFQPVEKYAASGATYINEIGKVDQVRFVLTDLMPMYAGGGAAVSTSGMLSAGGTNVDVYPTLLIGKDAIGSVALKGPYAASPYIVPNKPSAADPAGQVGYAVWKVMMAAAILNQAHIIRIEHGVVAAPT